MTFNPTRLVLARNRRGLSMKQLAEDVGIQPRSISGLEKGEFGPSENTAKELAQRLRFPIEFFYGTDIDAPPRHSVSFRALSRMPASERNAALGACGIALLLNDWIEHRFNLPTADLPDLAGEEPEAAAETVRADWQLGYRPIKNMIHVLESRGVRVFSLAEDTRRIDAFSFWRADTPFVFLNTKKSAERSRFDAAHELGHLVLHRHGGPTGQEAEAEANAFASALLMPASSVYGTVRWAVGVTQLIKLKKKWNVSAAALAYRLWKLKLLSDWNYRSVCIEMAPYRKEEPDPSPREQSQVLQKVFDSLDKDGITRADAANELGVYRRELEELVFGLAVVDGGTQTTRVRNPALKLVR